MSHEKTMKKISHFKEDWGERILLSLYHMRVINWWLLLIVVGLFVLFGGVIWFTLHTNTPHTANPVQYVTGASRFLLEAGAATIAGTLVGPLVLSDPMLELLLVSRGGIRQILLCRFLLVIFILFLTCVVYLAWSLALGVRYSRQESLLWFFLLWLAPVLFVSMLGLTVSFISHSAAIGAVFSGLLLTFSIFLSDYIITQEPLRLFFIALSLYVPDASDWWWNRLVLTCSGLILALWCWWWISRDERLLRTTT
jgi:hypothetical protein